VVEDGASASAVAAEPDGPPSTTQHHDSLGETAQRAAAGAGAASLPLGVQQRGQVQDGFAAQVEYRFVCHTGSHLKPSMQLIPGKRPPAYQGLRAFRAPQHIQRVAHKPIAGDAQQRTVT
jgi:hypothetical protein